MNIYNAQLRQSRLRVHSQQWTDETWACCRTESVSVSNVEVMVSGHSRAEEHTKQNCMSRRWQFLLPKRANLPKQHSTGDGHWHYQLLARTASQGGIMKTLKDQCEQFVHNSLQHWQQVEIISECRCYVVELSLSHDEPSCCMQNWLELFHNVELMWSAHCCSSQDD